MQSKRRALLATLALLIGAPTVASAQTSAVQKQFADAYRIARAGTPAVTPDSDELRDYVLYPYLEAARLSRDLTASKAIGVFVEQHRGEPVARALRRDWLVSLGERREWKAYLEEYVEGEDGGATLRCYSLAARLALGRQENLETDAVAAWLLPDSAPAACDPVFAWLKSRGTLTPSLIEQRARLALGGSRASLARFLARDLPAVRAQPVLLWADLIDRPQTAIDRIIATPGLAIDALALLDGWQRLARTDPDAALARYESLLTARRLEGPAASPYALGLALGLALNRRSEALTYFARVRPDDFDERSLEWHVRAALWARDWSRVTQAIAAMPESLATQNRWLYWTARAAEQGRDQARARELYARVMPTDNWYAVLSSARLGRGFQPSLQAIDFDAREVAHVATLPAMLRARELLACRMESEATTEWSDAYDSLTPAQQRAAIRLAADWNWHLQSIATAAKQSQFNDYPLLYPRPYDSIVRSAARMTDLPDASIYAVMRQESLYREDAGSSAGALGLMQLLPSTAQRTARRWDLRKPSRGDLLEPAVNVPLGAAELRNLLDRFDRQTFAAYAAYNAGPGAARRWLPATPLDADIWVENIPFNETRAYVQRVAWHSVVFTWLAAREPFDASAWLDKVSLPTSLAQAD